MREKTRHTKAWALAIIAIVLMSALIIYWYTTYRDVHSTVTVIKTTASAHLSDVPAVTELATTAEETTQIENTTPDFAVVTEAIDFLSTLEEQNLSGNSILTEDETADSSTELTQGEMFQLVREGVSYYDSLVESGSVDFFMEISSHPILEDSMIQAPKGTWEGTFAFSGNRVTGSVTQNATEYNEQHGSLHVFDTKHFAYDGETFEELRETPNGTVLTRGSDIRYNTAYDPRFWGWNLSDGSPFAELIDAINVEQIQSVNWDNASVYHIKGTVQEAVEVELWLNPQKSYRPERFMFSTEGPEQRHQVIKDFDFMEVAPDLWFPQSALSVTSLVNLETGAETSLETTTMHLTNVRINEPISARRFALEPPPGATIFDTRTHESFKVE